MFASFLNKPDYHYLDISTFINCNPSVYCSITITPTSKLLWKPTSRCTNGHGQTAAIIPVLTRVASNRRRY
jgi:hypothetical protein